MKIRKLCKYSVLCSGLLLFDPGAQASIGNILLQQSEVTLSTEQTSLKQLFEIIEQQTNLSFIYNSEEVNLNRKVALPKGTQSVEKVLETVFQHTGLSYSVNDRYIILKKAEEDAIRREQEALQKALAEAKAMAKPARARTARPRTAARTKSKKA